jgi:hypothetical protein
MPDDDAATAVLQPRCVRVEQVTASELRGLLFGTFGAAHADDLVPIIYPMRFVAEVASNELDRRLGAQSDQIPVHESQLIETRRALVPGEEVTAAATLKVSDRHANLVMRASDGDGVPLAQLVSRVRLVSTSMIVKMRVAGKDRSREPAANFTALLLTAELVASYAEHSGDRNPIHLDLARAHSFGFPERVAHGMLLAGLIEPALVIARLKGRMSELRVRFLAPAFVGELVNFGVARVVEDPEGWNVRVLIQLDPGPVACVADVVLVP